MTFSEKMANVGTGLGNFFGGIVNPVVGKSEEMQTKTTEKAGAGTIIVVVVVVVIIGIIIFTVVKSKKTE